MKRLSYSLLLVAVLSIIAIPSRAQLVPRTVLLEEGTNDGCGPCAAMNPGIEAWLKNHEGSVIHLCYHPDWPNSTDPMYLNDPTDAQYRVSTYYHITGVPSVAVNGCTPYVPQTPQLIENSFDSCIAIWSPVAIKISRSVSGSEVSVHVSLHAVQSLSSYKTLHLRVAAVEEAVPGPGPNGEKEYVHVMRTMMPNNTGMSIPSTMIDTAFDFSYELSSEYDESKMYEVAFLQSDQTKEVLQAASDQQTFQLVPDIGTQFVQRVKSGNSKSTASFTLKNGTSGPLDFKITYQSLSKNVWPVTVNEQGSNSTVTLSANEQKALTVQAARGSGSYSSGVLSVSSTVGGEPLVSSYLLKFVSSDATVAFIDVSGDSLRSVNTLATLDKLNVPYVPLTSTEAVAMNGWWGSSFPSIVMVANKWIVTGGDKARVRQYLKSGGHLLLSGGEIAYGLGDSRSTASDRDNNFLKYTLHATYVVDSAGPHTVHGVSSDSVSGSSALTDLDIYADTVDQSGTNYNQPDEIKPGANTVPIFYYGQGTSQCAGIRWDSVHANNAQSKLVYLAFGIQNLAAADREAIVNAAMNWFAESPQVNLGVKDRNTNELSLDPNFPNPFSSVTTIPYSTVQEGIVRIALTDVKGTEIEVIANEYQSAGAHTTSFDGSQLTPGTYFLTLRTADGSRTRAVIVE